MIASILNFSIHADTKLSKKYLDMNLGDFHQVVNHVLNLPYRQNSSKE